MRVLIVEDNPRMASAIQRGLSEHGFAASIAERAAIGEAEALTATHDVILLDVMLPDRDGVELCAELRKRGISTPILMLTGLTATGDVVRGLDAGADDYLAKPFELEELVARLRALLRRGKASQSSVLRYGDVELDLHRREVTRQEETVPLSGKEFMLLEYLMRNPDRVLARTQIAERVWDMNFEPSSNVIDVYISSLRRKLDRSFDTPLIHTIVGTGYRFGSMERSANK
ncbi:MAG: response regulator transcription factor [Phycisphaerales bacterium]